MTAAGILTAALFPHFFTVAFIVNPLVRIYIVYTRPSRVCVKKAIDGGMGPGNYTEAFSG